MGTEKTMVCRGKLGYLLPEKRAETKERLQAAGEWGDFVRYRTGLVVGGEDRGVAHYMALLKFPPGGVVPDWWVSAEEFRNSRLEKIAKAADIAEREAAADSSGSGGRRNSEFSFSELDAKAKPKPKAKRGGGGGSGRKKRVAPSDPEVARVVEEAKEVGAEGGVRVAKKGILAGMPTLREPEHKYPRSGIGEKVEGVIEINEGAVEGKIRGGEEILRSVFWIYDNIMSKGIRMEDAPSPGDYAYLMKLKSNSSLLANFYRDVYAKVLPSQSMMNERRKYESGIRGVDRLLERLMRVKGAVEGDREADTNAETDNAKDSE